MQPSDSRELRAAGRMETLMVAIRALGRLPGASKAHREDYALTNRLRRAKRYKLLNESQLAELEAMPAFREVVTPRLRQKRLETLMDKVRALGRLPRASQAHREEYELDARLRHAKRTKLLSEAQLAELAEMPGTSETRTVRLMAEIRALGHIPRYGQRHGAEFTLACRLHYAKAKSLLSASQLAELAEIARSSVEPLRKRMRVLDA